MFSQDDAVFDLADLIRILCDGEYVEAMNRTFTNPQGGNSIEYCP